LVLVLIVMTVSQPLAGGGTGVGSTSSGHQMSGRAGAPAPQMHAALAAMDAAITALHAADDPGGEEKRR
jgi:hypothetical protein